MRFSHAVRDLLEDRGIPYDFLITDGESLVTRARNNIVSTFLKTDYETLAMIDADIEMGPVDFIRLLELDGVRGAAVNMKRPDQAECLSAFSGKQWKRSEMPSKPFSVDYLGSAVLFIDKGIFECLKGYTAAYSDNIVGESWEFFPTGVVDGVLLSEDYYFCELCRRAEIEVVCDPAVIVNHYGTVAFSA